MSAKISGTHRKAFLQALAETGNYVIAAAEVRVSRDWAFRLRRRDAEFDAACREAVAEFRNSPVPPLPPFLARAPRESSSPAKGRGDSGALSLQGRRVVVEQGKGRRVQVKRARPDGWTVETAERFLAALAANCNVLIAAEAAGTSATSAHARRRRDPGFARAWEEALAIGHARLQAALVETATCFFEGEVLPDDNPIRTMSVAEAIHWLQRTERRVRR